MKKIKIYKNQVGYFPYYKDFDNDEEISNFIGMDIKVYRGFLINEFNGFEFSDNGANDKEIFFHNKEDANKALQWLEPRIIMTELKES